MRLICSASRHAVAFLVIAADVEVEVHVDAVLLQLGDQEVQPVELLGIEGAGIVFAAIGNAGGRPLVHEVQADDVDAITGQSPRPHGGVFFGRKLDRAGAPVGEMDAPEADPFAIGLDEVAALDADEAVLSGGRVVEEGEIGRRGSGGAVVDHIRLEQAIVPLDLGEAGKGKRGECGDKRGQPEVAC